MRLRDSMTIPVILTLLATTGPLTAQQQSSIATAAAIDARTKELYIPQSVNRVPDTNEYEKADSDFSFARMVEGPNVAIFWHREYGDVPMNNPDEARAFNPYRMLEETERYYRYYVDELGYVRAGQSVSDDKKLLVYVYGGDGGTAFGGGTEDVGIFWTPAIRVNREPYGVIAHELAHSFQFMSRMDSGTGARGGIGEMAAQYFLWQVLPEWQEFENYHLDNFMGKTHYAFLHGTNIYHSPYVIEYWSNKHGLKFWGELNRSTQPDEDVVATYKRMQELSQDAFNDEMFDAVRRFVTWDMPRIQEVSRPYRNQHESELIATGDGWQRIAPARAPQNYGYNAIRLDVPDAGTQIRLQFAGMAGAEGYAARNVELAGWRYGFVAYRRDESRVYSDVWQAAEADATFIVPEDTEHLWLVVMGAPQEHFPVAARRRGGDAPAEPPAEEAWPYRVRLTNTSISRSTR
ncbi:MAG: DUF6055 domain-containing protein [Gemmatimonadota bacterium]